MTTLTTPLIGRFGNQLFQYCAARAYAEQNGMALATPPWVGEEIFDLPPVERGGLPFNVGGYCQDQNRLIYTRTQVRGWLRLKPHIQAILEAALPPEPLLAHRRGGDYIGHSGYVVVSAQSYFNACSKFGLDRDALRFVMEESPTSVSGLSDFLPDFYRMMNCDVLLRGNSTFSYWAAVLGRCKVYSPVIDGLEGGKEQDCEFVPGNHPRFANLEFVTDLHLAE